MLQYRGYRADGACRERPGKKRGAEWPLGRLAPTYVSTLARVALTGNFDTQVVERMLEYVDVTSSWTRKLWSVSTITELRELLECSQAIAEGTLTSGTLQWLRGTLLNHIMKDPGLGATQARAALKSLLPKDELVANSHDWRRHSYGYRKRATVLPDHLVS